MKKENIKPGVMIYFDLIHVLPLLNDREKGILFEMILRYGKDGEEPPLIKTNKLQSIWILVKHRLDMDDTRYRNVTAHRKYAAYVRWCKSKGEEALDYDQWEQAGGLKNAQTYLDAENALA